MCSAVLLGDLAREVAALLFASKVGRRFRKRCCPRLDHSQSLAKQLCCVMARSIDYYCTYYHVTLHGTDHNKNSCCRAMRRSSEQKSLAPTYRFRQLIDRPPNSMHPALEFRA